MLTASQISRIRAISGLYEGPDSWLPDDIMQELADYVGAIDMAGRYDTAYDARLAIQCLRVAKTRGVPVERSRYFDERKLELEREIGVTLPPQGITSQVAQGLIDAHNTAPHSHDDIRDTVSRIQAGEEANLLNYFTKAEQIARDDAQNTSLAEETSAREAEDVRLQAEIDNIDLTIPEDSIGPRELEEGYIRSDAFPGTSDDPSRTVGAKDIERRAIGEIHIEDTLIDRWNSKQDALPQLGAGQVWVGNPPTPTALPTGGGGGTSGATPEQAAAIMANAAAIQTNSAAITEDGREIDAVEAAQMAANIDRQTVLVVGPDFVHEEAAARNISVSIAHPTNAYPTGTLFAVSVAGQHVVTDGYDPTLLHQEIIAEISAAVFENIWDQTDPIPDGMGGTNNVQRYPIGSFIPVDVRIITGRGGQTLFLRTEHVFVGASRAPRLIRPARGGVYTLLPTENFIQVEITNGAGKPFGRQIFRQMLSAVAENFLMDSRLPANTDTDNLNVITGFKASIVGNTVTISIADFVPGLAISEVWAW